MNNNTSNILQTSQWWGQRRKHYNISLVCAGVLAFICYATIVFTNTDIITDAEITIFTTLFQGVGYLIMMGVANICFFIGPISERLIKPKNVEHFRKLAYRMGYWFSVLLQFSIPCLLQYFVLFHPESWIK